MSEMMTPSVTNLTLTTTNTEYSVVLKESTRFFTFQMRTAVDVRYAFVTGKVAGSTAPYMTLKSGGVYSSPEKLALPLGGLTVYFANTGGGVVVELTEWY